MIPHCLCNHALPTQKKEVPSVRKRLLCKGAPLPMRFYANFTKGHELEEQKARSREKGEEQSFGVQPQGMNTI